MRYKRKDLEETSVKIALVIAGALIFYGIYVIIAFSWLNPGVYISFGIAAAIILYEVWRTRYISKIKEDVFLKFEQNPDASINDIAQTTGLSKENLRDIILDLRGSGRLMGEFSDETGFLETAPVKEKEQDYERYCPHCGAKYRKDNSTYCVYCGNEKLLVK